MSGRLSRVQGLQAYSGRREKSGRIYRYLAGLGKRRSIGSKGVGGLELGWYM